MTRKKDDFDGPDTGVFGGMRDRLGLRGPAPAAVAIGILAVELAVVIWRGFPRADAPAEGLIPVVRADAAPYRTAPDNPGGMPIPHRDSTVFNALHAGAGEPAERDVENLLSQPEQPLPREQIFPGLAPERPAANAAAPVDDSVPPQPAPLSPAAAPPDAPAEHSLPDKSTAPPVAGTAAPSGEYYVQLGSVQSEAEAQAGWKKLQSSHPAQLGALKLRVQPVTLAKGRFYRMQGGPLGQQAARDICHALEEKKPGGCLVVKP